MLNIPCNIWCYLNDIKYFKVVVKLFGEKPVETYTEWMIGLLNNAVKVGNGFSEKRVIAGFLNLTICQISVRFKL
jgi:hypothetical protein